MLRRPLAYFFLLTLCQGLSLTAEMPPTETGPVESAPAVESTGAVESTDAAPRTYVVTASRDSEDVMSAPATLTVITADQITASGKTNIVQVLEDVPGIAFRSYSGEAEAQVTMRGFGENSFGRVVVLVDGKRLNNPDMAGLNWLSIPLGSIERIEVLDGPSAVLYGSGAVGGVINIITKENSHGVTASAEVSYGSFNTSRLSINGGYGTDGLGFLVSADIYRSDGYRDRTANKNSNVTLLGFADVTDKLTLKPSFTFSDIEYQMPGALTKAQFDDDPTQAANLKDDGTERDLGGALTILFRAGDNLGIEAPLSYLHKNRQSDVVSWPTNPYTDRLQHQLEAKPKLTFTRDTGLGPLRLIGGLDFDGTFYNAKSYSDAERTAKTYDFDVSQWACAPYLSGTLGLPHGFAATSGLRYNYAAITADKQHAVIAVDPVTYAKTYGNINESDSYRALVYDLALNCQPVDSLAAYAKYNTLFRYPFIDEKAELLGYSVDRFNMALKPETGWNVEVGAKYRPAKNISIETNGYYMRMKDEIAYTTSNVNLDETARLGGRLIMSVAPVQPLELSANVNYVQASFASGSNKGDSLSIIPSVTGGADARVKLPGGLTVAADAAYTGKTTYWYKDAWGSVEEKLDSYWLFGLCADYRPAQMGGRLAVVFRVDNLLDVKYPSCMATGSDPVTYAYYAAYYPGTGRALNVSVAYKY